VQADWPDGALTKFHKVAGSDRRIEQIRMRLSAA